jgi:hypothetical protein
MISVRNPAIAFVLAPAVPVRSGSAEKLALRNG